MDSVQSQHTIRAHTVPTWVLRHSIPLGLALALSLPCLAQAIGIGDIVLQSHLGEPLKAKVSLSLGDNESISADCLALTVPDSGSPDDFLTQASVSLQQDKGTTVLIRGLQPLNQMFVRLQLQVRCPGQGSVSRTFTVLPSPDAAPGALPIVDPSPIQSPTTGTATPIKTKPASRPASAPSPRQSNRNPRAATKLAQASDDRSAPITRKAPEIGEFHLRLSTSVIDTSRIGKLDEAERNKILAQQRQLDQDDQTASFLALQHQVVELQEELKLMRLQMAQGITPAAGSAPAPARPASAPAAAAPAKPAAPAAAPVPEPDTGLVGNLTLALIAILLLLLGLRQYNKRLKSQWTGASIVLEDGEVDPVPAPAQPAQPSPLTEATPLPSDKVPAPAAPESVPVPVPPTQAAVTEPQQESDWVIEEAELYAVHGHPDLAIQILEKLLEQSPDKPQAWLLLLSILSSLDRREDFEQAAHRFATLDTEQTYWKEVQALGQRIDKDNPLYFGEVTEVHEPVLLSKANRRPLGAILLDIGALTEEQLMDALAQFNPRRDGRIGAFLIKHELIDNEQLEEALRIQRAEREADAA
jgi:tetratricopeptide (TPR) repeat protein